MQHMNRAHLVNCTNSSIETKVPLEDEEGYENISVLQGLGQ